MSIDLSKYSVKKDMNVFLSASEKAIIEWLEDNGFSGKLTTANINKIEFVVEKDGVKDILEVTSTRKATVESALECCENFRKAFDLKCENARLRKLLEAKRVRR